LLLSPNAQEAELQQEEDEVNNELDGHRSEADQAEAKVEELEEALKSSKQEQEYLETNIVSNPGTQRPLL
jgi:chromosome segregation ATPase